MDRLSYDYRNRNKNKIFFYITLHEKASFFSIHKRATAIHGAPVSRLVNNLELICSASELSGRLRIQAGAVFAARRTVGRPVALSRRLPSAEFSAGRLRRKGKQLCHSAAALSWRLLPETTETAGPDHGHRHRAAANAATGTRLRATSDRASRCGVAGTSIDPRPHSSASRRSSTGSGTDYGCSVFRFSRYGRAHAGRGTELDPVGVFSAS